MQCSLAECSAPQCTAGALSAARLCSGTACFQDAAVVFTTSSVQLAQQCWGPVGPSLQVLETCSGGKCGPANTQVCAYLQTASWPFCLSVGLLLAFKWLSVSIEKQEKNHWNSCIRFFSSSVKILPWYICCCVTQSNRLFLGDGGFPRRVRWHCVPLLNRS